MSIELTKNNFEEIVKQNEKTSTCRFLGTMVWSMQNVNTNNRRVKR